MYEGTRTTLSVRTKLLLVLAIAVVGMLALAILALSAQKSMLLENRKIKTRHVVETAYGVLQHFHALQEKGQITEEKAKQDAIAAVKALRYETSEYFWINDLQPRVVMHPIKPELDGKDVSDAKDPAGKALFVEFVKVARDSGAGYVDYLWPKPGATEPVAKTSYVMLFKPWGWVIGSGIYVDDVARAYWSEAGKLGAAILVLGAVLVSVMLYLLRGILNPLKALEAAIIGVQHTNDLTQRIAEGGDDEIGRIARAFNAMIASFRQAVSHAIENSTSLTSASSQLTGSSARIADASRQQSDSVSSMAAAMEELTVSIGAIKGSAGEAQEIVCHAGELSGQGGEIVSNTVTEIHRIAEAVKTSAEQIHELGQRTDQISAIVKTIKEIADQTNLLALNAAIEAARAGEQGRGFAVVADEVRSLAERTTKSTEEIASMISGIQSGMAQAVASMDQGQSLVREGVRMAGQAGESMHQIQSEAQRVVSSVSAISTALNEQSAAATLVAQNVERIAQMIENNGEGTRQIAAAARGLEDLARGIHGAVSHFRV